MKTIRTTVLLALLIGALPLGLRAPAYADDEPAYRDAASVTSRVSDRSRRYFAPLEWKTKDWTLSPWGYLRLEYESVETDDRYNFIGRNDGFILDNARLGFDLNYRDQVLFVMSLEGASDVHEDTNTPLGKIEVRLRDAFVRYDLNEYVGAQGGQFKAPFAAEELRSTADLLFVSRAVGWDGVLVGRGFEQPGIELDRQLGIMLSPRKPIRFGDFGAAYYLMAGNGNGNNQLLNDNSRLAVIGRVEGAYSNFVTLGAAGFTNDRRIDIPSNQAREDDVGVAADLLINPDPVEIFFQFGQVETDFPTTGVSSRIRRTWHVQAGYRFDTPWFCSIEPAYRFAQYDPWANAGSQAAASANALGLDYHTFGLKVAAYDVPITMFFNYTLTGEQQPRELNNDRIQILAQVEF
jgi:hypothetical protein